MKRNLSRAGHPIAEVKGPKSAALLALLAFGRQPSPKILRPVRPFSKGKAIRLPRRDGIQAADVVDASQPFRLALSRQVADPLVSRLRIFGSLRALCEPRLAEAAVANLISLMARRASAHVRHIIAHWWHQVGGPSVLLVLKQVPLQRDIPVVALKHPRMQGAIQVNSASMAARDEHRSRIDAADASRLLTFAAGLPAHPNNVTDVVPMCLGANLHDVRQVAADVVLKL